MKVTSILANNGIKLLSGLANNESSLTAMVLKDWIGDGATVYTYKKEGGKDDAREKAIEEFGTGALWLFGIPTVKKIIDKTVYPIFKLNPNFDPRILNDKNALDNAKKLAPKIEQDLFKNLDNKNPIFKSLTNAQMYKGLTIAKFAIATIATAIGLTKLIKYKQKTTSDRIQNECKKNKNLGFNSTLVQKSVNKNKTFETFTSNKVNKNLSFTGLSDFMYNPIKNTMILDGVIATTRLKEARKEERIEVAFKELCQVVFIYGLAEPIQWIFEGIGKLTKCPIKLDPKNLFDKDLISKINDSKESIQILRNSNNITQTLVDIMETNPTLINLLDNEGVISLTKDKKALSMLKPFDKSAINKALDNLENMGIEEHAKNLSKSKAFKGFAVVANVLIAAGIMGVIQPKLTIWLRKKLFGTNENPAIAQQEKQANLNA